MRTNSTRSNWQKALAIRVWTAATKLALVLALFLSPARGWAAPFAKNFVFTQPDGKELKLWGEGDEFHAVFETPAGYTVVFEAQASAYFYARREANGKRLISTGVLADRAVPPGLAQHLRADRDAVAADARARQQQWDRDTGLSKRWARLKSLMLGTPPPPGALPAPPTTPTLGTKVGLTLLIDFSDAPATISRGEIDAFCNGDAYSGFGNNGSVKKYFSDMSAGRLTYSNVVTIYIRMAQPKSYYNDTTKDCGLQARLLINDALAILKARPDYATTILPTFNSLTTDGSGNVVAFNVFFAGGDSGVWMYGLWPHSWALAASIALGNGKSLWHYEITNVGTSLELGTFCHENGHMLCDFPDIYDYDYDSNGGAGDFCLMNSGGHGVNPVQVCAYLKLAAGWATVTDLDSTSNLNGTLVAAPYTGYDHFYRYRQPGVTTEYFLLENRQWTGRDANLPAAGIAAWHVDELGDRDNQSLAPNSSHLNYEVTLVQADNQWHFEYNLNDGDIHDLYYQGNSAFGYVNRLDDSSAPNAHWWNGLASGLSISNFSLPSASMTFRVGNGAIALTPPVLAQEPLVTAGSANTIFWMPGNSPGEIAGSALTGLDSSIAGSTAEITATSRCPDGRIEWQSDDPRAMVAEAVLPKDKLSRVPGIDWLKPDQAIKAEPQPVVQDIFTETFETIFPDSNWTLYGNPTWDDTSYSYHNGFWSGWCAASTYSPIGGYVDNMNSWMVYGPFTLADATNAAVNFWYKNYSESGYDYLGWYASTNGANFYGEVVSGNQNTWRSQAFSLTNVYTLGNLCGKSQVWIAIVFTSDSIISGGYGYTGAFVDDIAIQKETGSVSADLTNYQPMGWNDKIPIGTTQLNGTNAHSYNGLYAENQVLYFNWASFNQGGAAAAGYSVHVEVTGTGGRSWDWSDVSTPAGYYTYLTMDQAVGPLAAGNHTFKVWLDYNGAVPESNEGNNYYERTVTVGSPPQLQYYAECVDNLNFTSPQNSGWLEQTQYAFNSLITGQPYWYRVKARQGAQTSDWSNVECSLQGGPRFSSITVQNGTNRILSAIGAPNQQHILQASSNLVDWINLRTNVAGADGLWLFTDPTHDPTRFYRLKF